MSLVQQTLVLIKPDGVKRGLMGRILSRFEDAGLKIVAMKLRQSDEAHALRHYTEDITVRRGARVREQLVDFLKTGPVLAIVLEGIEAVEVVRKMAGATEPKAALPGTIRGDFSHVSFGHANEKDKAVENLIHASANAEEAKYEVSLWFNQDEFSDYKTVHEAHTL